MSSSIHRIFRTWLGGAVLLGALAAAGCGEASAPRESEAAATASSSAIQPIDVWLDVDPAIGLPSSEVDDGLMLLQAFHSPELHIRGISVVFGNTSLENGVPIAREVTSRFGPPGLAVAAGAASAEELGKETAAVRAMAAALEEAPLQLLAVGPVTNAASLVRLHPELHSRIEAIVMVAARRVGQSFRTGDPSNLPHRDFNFELDPPAMKVILDTEIPLVFAPWEVSSRVWLRSEDLDDLAARSPAGAWAAESCRSWVERWNQTLGVDGFNPFDTLAVAWLTHPQMIDRLEVGVWIERAEDDRAPGSGELKPYLFVDPENRDLRQAIYTYRPDSALQSLLKERIAGAPEGSWPVGGIEGEM